jgi:glucose dehydrogenase
MGKVPKKFVVDSYCKSHEVENLFVIGASLFVRGRLNPTLKVAAISMRSFKTMNSIYS